MRRGGCLGPLLRLGACASPDVAPSDPATPRLREADEILGASALRLLTLDPTDALALEHRPRFEDYRVLAAATLDDPADRRALVLALDDAVAHGDPRETKCEFVPHHALQATTTGGEIDVAICFTCGEAQVWRGGEPAAHYRIAAGRNAAIEALVDAHDLRRAAGAP